MSLTCTKCHRINPAEATYCYFDGFVLPGHAQSNGGPVNAGTQRFPADFVFPSGRSCRNFDELALGCVQDSPAAGDLLQGGYLESFLAGIGRADLALIARQAGGFPDRERGLDMLIEKLPSKVVEPPKLHVEPLHVNLGQMAIEQDRRVELHILNQGMRLLYGTIVVEKGNWLALGEEPGVPEKSFNCEHELVIPVLIQGKKLKAGKAPLEGKIVIESNGGAAEIIVRVEVPVKPFPSGVLAGARTQRQLAEAAFKKPKEAAPQFENGEVSQWYVANGWIYPVQGPPATGLAAVQQYLEACGLTQPPRVEIDTSSLRLQGAPGRRLERTIRVKALEKKPAFAYATSDQTWLVPRRAILNGATASIPVEIPVVPPDQNGGPLSAQLTVIANGRQKFIVPVSLQVVDDLNFGGGAPIAQMAGEEPPVFDLDEPELIEAPPAPRAAQAVWLHLMPGILLLLVLMGLSGYDWLRSRDDAPANGDSVERVDNAAYLRILFNDMKTAEQYPYRFRFGLTIDAGPERGKELTFLAEKHKGQTNNTCLKIDGKDYLFGDPNKGTIGKDHKGVDYRPFDHEGAWRAIWEYPEQTIRVTQDVSLRRSDQTGKLETCLVRYKIENYDAKKECRVGLRFLLDTFIGSIDGVPFMVPGRSVPVETMDYLTSVKSIPDHVLVLERGNVKNPGTVAHLTLKLQDPEGKLAPPSRVQLGAWPDHRLPASAKPGVAANEMTLYEVPRASMKSLRPADSAVVIYWDEQSLGPGQTREMAFAYGLGHVSGTTGEGGKQLGLSADGAMRPGGEFTVTALVGNPNPGQTAELVLPDGLKLVDSNPAKQNVRAGSKELSPVTWRVKAERKGEFEITVRSGGLSQSKKITIRDKSFLD